METDQFKKCVDIIKIHLESGDSFTLSKVKAMRAVGIDQYQAKYLRASEDYQKLKYEIQHQHRFDKSWTNLINN